MNDAPPAGPRSDALRRAEQFSPFLREAVRALPDIADVFEQSGAEAAVKLALSATADDRESTSSFGVSNVSDRPQTISKGVPVSRETACFSS